MLPTKRDMQQYAGHDHPQFHFCVKNFLDGKACPVAVSLSGVAVNGSNQLAF